VLAPAAAAAAAAADDDDDDDDGLSVLWCSAVAETICDDDIDAKL